MLLLMNLHDDSSAGRSVEIETNFFYGEVDRIKNRNRNLRRCSITAFRIFLQYRYGQIIHFYKTGVIFI